MWFLYRDDGRRQRVESADWRREAPGWEASQYVMGEASRMPDAGRNGFSGPATRAPRGIKRTIDYC
jgi:hypothetical protein